MELQQLLKKTIILSKAQLKQVIEDRAAAERQKLLLRRVKDSLIQEIFEKKNP